MKYILSMLFVVEMRHWSQIISVFKKSQQTIHKRAYRQHEANTKLSARYKFNIKMPLMPTLLACVTSP